MNAEFLKKEENKKVLSYAGLIFVVLVWGSAPLLTVFFLDHFSATIYSAFGGLTSAIALTLICAKHLKKLNKDYLKIALPTGLFNALATVLQKIGLQYTTPTQYAFLENLSCVIVPFLTWFLVKRKPSGLKILAALLCLAGSFILSGVSASGISFGIGEILCAAAGLLYGVNIAVTGAYSKKLMAGLYIMIHMWVQTVVAFLMAFALNGIRGTDGMPLEVIVLPQEVGPYLAHAFFVLLSSTFCWVLRTNCMKRVDASVVAVIMPFSAVVTGIASVLAGLDTLSVNLVLGAGLGLVAVFLSGYGDIRESKRIAVEREKLKNEE